MDKGEWWALSHVVTKTTLSRQVKRQIVQEHFHISLERLGGGWHVKFRINKNEVKFV